MTKFAMYGLTTSVARILARKPVPAGRVLDYRTAAVQSIAKEAAGISERETVLAAMTRIQQLIRPIYSIDEARPASQTIEYGAGSCSQRFAVLESVARAAGIHTRVEGLIVDGSFWHSRFPIIKSLIPKFVVVPWPSFQLEEDQWTAVENISDANAPCSISGTPETTLFEAARFGIIARKCPGTGSFRAHVVGSLGIFDDREELISLPSARLFGRPVAAVAEVVLRVRSSGLKPVAETQ